MKEEETRIDAEASFTRRFHLKEHRYIHVWSETTHFEVCLRYSYRFSRFRVNARPKSSEMRQNCLHVHRGNAMNAHMQTLCWWACNRKLLILADLVAFLVGLVSVYQLNCLLYLLNAALYYRFKKQVSQSSCFSRQVTLTLYYLSDEGKLRKTANAFELSRSTVSVAAR